MSIVLVQEVRADVLCAGRQIVSSKALIVCTLNNYSVVLNLFFGEKACFIEKNSTFATPIRKGLVSTADLVENVAEKFLKKIWKVKNFSYFCTPKSKKATG